MLLALVELQQFAYADIRKRTPKMVLRTYNQSYALATTYISLFYDNLSVNSSRRSLFGLPFHSIVVHLPEMLWLINDQSIVAEQAEDDSTKQSLLLFIMTLEIILYQFICRNSDSLNAGHPASSGHAGTGR